jgi:hypothetical protein
MIKSGREKHSEKVGTAICNIEYSVWISEFDKRMHFKLIKQKCKDSKYCILDFEKD